MTIVISDSRGWLARVIPLASPELILSSLLC